MADGNVSQYMGKVDNIPVLFADVIVNPDYLVMVDLPFDVIFGCQTMEELETDKDPRKRGVSTQID